MPPTLNRTLDSLATPTTAGVNPQRSVDPNAYQQFSLSLLDLMKRRQSLGTAPFVRQSLNAQEEQANRISQTPQNLIGASPQLQSGVRSASAAALSPTISGAQQGAQTFSEQLSSFGNLVNLANQIGQQQQASQEREQDRAFNQVMALVSTYGGQAFQGADEQTLKNLEKSAGLPTGFLTRVQALTPLSQQITPLQQEQLDLQRQQLAQQQSQFESGQQISPFQQAQIDIDKQRLQQQQQQFAESQRQFNVQEKRLSEQTPDILGNAQTGYFTMKDGVLTPLRQKLPGGPYIESGSGRKVEYTDEINPNSFYIAFGSGNNVEGASLLGQAEGRTDLIEVSPGASLFDPKTNQRVFTAPTAKSQDTGGGGSFDITGSDWEIQ